MKLRNVGKGIRRAVRTPPAVLVDVLASKWLARRGFRLMPASRHAALQRTLLDLADYVSSSGHLHTVSGRVPRAVDRIAQGSYKALMHSRPTPPTLDEVHTDRPQLPGV